MSVGANETEQFVRYLHSVRRGAEERLIKLGRSRYCCRWKLYCDPRWRRRLFAWTRESIFLVPRSDQIASAASKPDDRRH